MSVQAEMSVLGCMLLEESAAREAADKLAPEMFLNDTTRRIFSAALDRYWAGKPLDGVTMIQELPADKNTLLKLAQYVPTTRHIGEYIRIVWDDWRRKSIEIAAGEIMTEAKNHTAEESVELLRELVKQQDLITRANTDSGQSFPEAVEQFLSWAKAKQDMATVKSGYRSLDFATGGFLRQSVTALCARSGGGKTDFALNLAIRMVRKGYKVQYFSMEMPTLQLMQRIASQIMRIDGTLIRDRVLNEGEMMQMERLLKTFENGGRLRFVEEPHISLQRLRHNIDLFKPDAVFIDHIGLMERPNIKDSYRALGLISNGIKQLALEKNIAVIELAQMNRQIEGRKDKKPSLADIRESGDIEQDVDYAMFLQPEEEMSDRTLQGDAWGDTRLFLLKNRHGRPGTFPFHWQPQYHTFTEVETRYGN